MWDLDYKNSWEPKNWCFWTVVLEKTLEGPLDCKEIKPFNLKENQLWILMGCTDAKAETPVFCSSDANSWLIGKALDTGKDWGQEKRATEDEIVGWHHRLYGYEFEQTLGDRQGSLVYYSLWVCKELDTTTWLNNSTYLFITFGVLAATLSSMQDDSWTRIEPGPP